MQILSDYITVIWGLIHPWIVSIPTWLIVCVIIFFIMKCAGAAIKTALRVIVTTLLLSFLLGLFGISLPSISDIVSFIQGVIHG